MLSKYFDNTKKKELVGRFQEWRARMAADGDARARPRA